MIYLNTQRNDLTGCYMVFQDTWVELHRWEVWALDVKRAKREGTFVAVTCPPPPLASVSSPPPGRVRAWHLRFPPIGERDEHSARLARAFHDLYPDDVLVFLGYQYDQRTKLNAYHWLTNTVAQAVQMSLMSEA
jgi:hypothetical protein